jgi:outer membrane protein
MVLLANFALHSPSHSIYTMFKITIKTIRSGWGILALFGLCCSAVEAQQKIGYTNPDYLYSLMPEKPLIDQILQGVKANNDTLLKQKIVEFNQRYLVFEQMQKDPKKDEVIFADLARELQNKQTQIQEFERNIRFVFLEKEQKFMAPVMEKIRKAISEVAAEQGFSHVFNTYLLSGNFTTLFFADPAGDLTNAVMKKLDIAPLPEEAPATAAPKK